MATYIRTDWEPRNEYTSPLTGTPVYRNRGIIKAVTEDKEKIQVGEIIYEHFENEEFQYIISPFWPITDMLSTKVFQGIPGIDMELRLEHYYRVNYVPIFITERTPGPNREDLWELLDCVGLDYYDRLEWLIRTDLRAAVDNLIVERARGCAISSFVPDRQTMVNLLETSQYGDEIIIENLTTLGRNSKECTKMLNRLMHYGVRLISKQEELQLDVERYKEWMPLFSKMHELDEQQRKRVQKEGIERAKSEGIYKGRKCKEVDQNLLEEVMLRFQKKEIALNEALKITGLSKSTFYRRMHAAKCDLIK